MNEARVSIALVDDVSQRLESISRAFVTFQGRLETLQRSLAPLFNTLTRLGRSLGAVRNMAEGTGQSFQDMREACARSAQPMLGSLTRMGRSLSTVRSMAQGTGQAMRGMASDLQRVNQSSQQATSSFGRFLEAASDFKLSTDLDALGAGIGSAGRYLQDLAGAGLRQVGASVQSAISLESSEAALKNTLTGPQAEQDRQARELGILAQRLGSTLPGSSEEMTKMFVSLRQQGVGVQAILDGVGQATAEFAVLNQMSFEEAAVKFSKIGEAMGLSAGAGASQANQLVDVMARTKGASGLTSDQLFETFKYLAPSLQSLGIGGSKESAQQISAVLGMLTKAGIEGSSAGTGLSGALGRMATANQRMLNERFKSFDLVRKHGLVLEFYDKKGNFRGLPQMIAELSKLNILNAQEQSRIMQDIFGEEAGRSMQVLINQGTKGYQAMLREMERQKSSQVQIEQIMETSAMKLETMQGNAESVVKSFGKLILESFQLPGVFDWLAQTLEQVNSVLNSSRFQSFFKELANDLQRAVANLVRSSPLLQRIVNLFKEGSSGKPYWLEWLSDPRNEATIRGYVTQAGQLLATLAKFGGALAGVGVGLTAVNLTLKAINIGASVAQLLRLPALFSAIGQSAFWTWLKGILPSLSSVLTMAVTGKLAAALGGVAVAAFLVYKYWKPIVSFFKGFWEGLKIGFVQHILPIIQDYIKAISPIIEGFKVLFSLFGGQVEASGAEANVGKALGQFIMGLVSDMLFMTKFYIALLSGVVSALAWLGEQLAVISLWFESGGLGRIFSSIYQFFADLGRELGEFFKRSWSECLKIIGSWRRQLGGYYERLKSLGGELINQFIEGLKSIDLGAAVDFIKEQIRSRFSFWGEREESSPREPILPRAEARGSYRTTNDNRHIQVTQNFSGPTTPQLVGQAVNLALSNDKLAFGSA